MALILKNGIWVWSDGSDPVTSPAALFAPVICPRSITFTIAGSPGVTINVVEDGAGDLDFSVTVNATASRTADLSGLFLDLTNSKLSTLSVSGDPDITQFITGAESVINLKNGVNLNGLGVPAFDVGMEFGLAGIGSNHLDIQVANFVLSDTAHNLSIDDLHPAGETGNVGIRTLSVGQKLAAVAPYAPTATPDTVTTLEDHSIVIPVSALATDKNIGAKLTIGEIGTGDQGPQYGTVTVAPDGQSLTYTPTTLDYEVAGILTGNQDAFQICITDNFGGEVTSTVTVNATPVADPPTVSIQLLPTQPSDPFGEVRYLVTAQSGDYGTVDNGSDYINGLVVGLSGTNTSGLTITDSKGLYNSVTGAITPSGPELGLFTDEIDVTTPVGGQFIDNLGVTATAEETENTGSPATASTSASTPLIGTLEDVPVTVTPASIGIAAFTSVAQPAAGSTSISSGDVIYTPTLDDSTTGRDSFNYAPGGSTSGTAATIVTPVADPPTVSISVLPAQPGDSVGETRLMLTAQSGDYGTSDNGADYIKGLQLNLTGNDTGLTMSDTDGLLNTANDTITPAAQSGLFTDQIDVFAPLNTNVDDTLGVTATNAETEGFGSPATATGSGSQTIAIDASSQSFDTTFQASNQSIWGPGPAFNFTFNKFLGGSTSFGGTIGGTTLNVGATANAHIKLKAGLQADLHITSGNLNATLPFDISLDSTFNKTTDTLEIDPTATALSGGAINTTGPGGSLSLALIFDVMAKLGGSIHYLVGSTSGSTSFGTNLSIPIINNFTSGKLSHSFSLGGGVSFTVAWPQVNTSGGSSTNPNVLTSTGTSNNALALNVDPIALAFDLLGLPDPFDFSFGPINIDLLSGKVNFGLALGQQFNLNDLGLTSSLTLQDGTNIPFTFGTPIVIPDALSHETSNDGKVSFALGMTPDATVQNQTDLVPNITLGLTVLKASFPTVGITAGPLANPSVNFALGSIPLHSSTFPVTFAQNTQHLSVT